MHDLFLHLCVVIGTAIGHLIAYGVLALVCLGVPYALCCAAWEAVFGRSDTYEVTIRRK